MGTPPRSVLKRLLTTSGRRLSRLDLEDDLWPAAEMELAEKNLANALTVLRRLLGRRLVETMGSLCGLAGQAQIWTDLEACRQLLKGAENAGRTTLQAVPLLEEAHRYLERGACLEDESEQWVHAVRADAERLLRQCRWWLAEGYGEQGKLWQAGELYRAMMQVSPGDEEALLSWMQMLARAGKISEALKCYQEMKVSVEAQGYALSDELEQVAASFRYQFSLAPVLPVQAVQIMPPLLIEQPDRDVLVLTDNDVSGRLAALLAKSSIAFGAGETRRFDQQTRLYWQIREETSLSVAALYPSVIKHIDSLTMALACSHLPAVRQQLCEIISRTVLLAGILLYDMGQYAKARKKYQIAFQAAVEAGNPVLQAVIYGWMSFTWTYSQQYQEALYCIQYARHRAAPTSDIFVQAWLAAIEAEVQSHLLNRDACAQWLSTLDRSTDVLPSSDTAYLFEFSPALLLGYKGVCLQQFYQKQEPATYSFLREAEDALERALTSEAPLKRKLYYLSDLASIYARQGEVEKACDYVAQSLPAVLQIGGSKTIHKHLLSVRSLLKPYGDVASVQDLDAQLSLLHLRA